MTFVGDYRPTKRVGVEELDGAVKLMRGRVDESFADADARQRFYEGAWLALMAIRHGRFEYPGDFMARFERDLGEYLEGGA